MYTRKLYICCSFHLQSLLETEMNVRHVFHVNVTAGAPPHARKSTVTCVFVFDAEDADGLFQRRAQVLSEFTALLSVHLPAIAPDLAAGVSSLRDTGAMSALQGSTFTTDSCIFEVRPFAMDTIYPLLTFPSSSAAYESNFCARLAIKAFVRDRETAARRVGGQGVPVSAAQGGTGTRLTTSGKAKS